MYKKYYLAGVCVLAALVMENAFAQDSKQYTACVESHAAAFQANAGVATLLCNLYVSHNQNDGYILKDSDLANLTQNTGQANIAEQYVGEPLSKAFASLASSK